MATSASLTPATNDRGRKLRRLPNPAITPHPSTVLPPLKLHLLATLSLFVFAQPPLAAQNFQDEVIRLTNAARAENGLPALTPHNQLARAAQKHAIDMGENDFFSHTGLDGSSPTSRAAAEGYSGGAGENIAGGQDSPQSVVDAWLKSPGHRANILRADYLALGVGYHLETPDEGSSPYVHYWVQVFGLSLAGFDQGAPPSPSPSRPVLIKPNTIKVLSGQRIRTTISANVKAREFRILGNPPPGLKLRRNSGRLVGTITETGIYRIRVQATFDSQKLDPINLRIRVR